MHALERSLKNRINLCRDALIKTRAPPGDLFLLQLQFHSNFETGLPVELEYNVYWKELALSVATRSGEERLHCIQTLDFQMIS